jgi:hypothetical protein
MVQLKALHRSSTEKLLQRTPGRKNMVEVKRISCGASSRFEVYLDNSLYCYTTDDNDGFKLMIAVNRLQAKNIFGRDYGNINN